MTTPRTIDELGYKVADDVLHAIALLRNRYGAKTHRDSKQRMGKGGRPTWIFELPEFEAEVGVPMNKRDLTLYMRNRTLDGRKLTDLLPQEKVAKVYPRDGRPARSIKDSSFLGIANGNESVMLELERGDLEPLFDVFFATPVSAPAAASAAPLTPDPKGSAGGKRTPIGSETFEALLERRSEVGQAGELLAVQDELERLVGLGCPEPHRWVERVALVDVGRCYDIASTWPGHERFIEVKSATSSSGGLFITSNEKRVLADLGERAWLYRVVMKADGNGEVVIRLQDPMRTLPPEAFEPVVFQIGASALTRAVTA